MKSPAVGFTLLEVLVALAVLATTLSAGYATTRSATATTDALYDQMLGHWVALNMRTRLVIGDIEAPEPLQIKTVMLGRGYVATVSNSPNGNVAMSRVDAPTRVITQADIRVTSSANGNEVAKMQVSW